MLIDGIKIKGITSDFRQVKKDYVFVAITGETYDGNNFIDLAVQKGAVVIYTERDIYRKNCIIKRVENSRKALAELCNEFYDYPSEKFFVIGVTGTKGKIRTVNLIHHITNRYGIKSGVISSLNIKFNEKKYPLRSTNLATEDIYYYLNRMANEGIKVVVMEMSAHVLKHEMIHGIKFDIAIYTNIGQNYPDFNKTIDNYVKSKKKLFDNLYAGRIALINSDDKYALDMLRGNSNILVITYGLSSKSTVNASSIDIGFITSFNYCLQRGITTLSGIGIEPFEYPIVSNLLKNHDIYNALSVITTCLLLDISINDIVLAIK
ncbi:MAG: Mur ligase family protein [Alkaliphilus sp.]|nr:Mur ligase family protein [Alkaliphilus sp.]